MHDLLPLIIVLIIRILTILYDTVTGVCYGVHYLYKVITAIGTTKVNNLF